MASLTVGMTVGSGLTFPCILLKSVTKQNLSSSFGTKYRGVHV